jgi:2-polyprenyl-3-methyl-5-hydroxy-6-metoxy-1,4-benzoquinol methylase
MAPDAPIDERRITLMALLPPRPRVLVNQDSARRRLARANLHKARRIAAKSEHDALGRIGLISPERVVDRRRLQLLARHDLDLPPRARVWCTEIDRPFENTASSEAPPSRTNSARAAVLDVGCGTGTFGLLLSNRGLEVTGVDRPAPRSTSRGPSRAASA